MIKRILAIILFAVGLLIYLFFRDYKGSLIPYSWAFYLIGLTMWIAGFVLFRNSKSIKENKAIAQLKVLVDELIANGEKIIVNLDKCEIKENSYTEERDKWQNENLIAPTMVGDLPFWNGLYDARGRTQVVDINQSVLIYTHLHNGAEEKFISKVIPRTKEDLKFKLYFQKNTILYVDKGNRNRFYFDLAFLNPEE